MLLIFKSVFKLFLYFVLICDVLSIHNIMVTKDTLFNGDKMDVDISQCSNLPSNFANGVWSVNTRNRCARLYNGTNCLGNFIEILPRSPSHGNLGHWHFGGQTKSVGPCPEVCSTEIVGNATSNSTGVKVQLFDRADYKGAYHDINLGDGCTPLPKSIINDVNSVDTNGHCIQLYNTQDCKLTGESVDTIELRQGIPFHHEIKKNWHFPVVKAISLCNYKCKRGASGSRDVELEKIPRQGEVTLYNEGNFEGIHLKLNVSGYGCTNITGYWEGLAESVRMGINTCVKLFDRRGCTGKSLFVNSSIYDLSRVKFDGRTRSVQECFVGNSKIVDVDLSRDNTLNHSNSDAQQLVDKTEGHSTVAITLIVLIVVMIVACVLVLRYYKSSYPYGHLVDRVRGILRRDGRLSYGNRVMEEPDEEERNSTRINFDMNRQNVDLLS